MKVEAVLATSNPGKAREVEAILAGSALQIVQLPIWIGEVETGTSYLENARLKASAVSRMVGRPVLAEDAGIEVDALGGRPGIHSARFAGPAATSEDNNAKLLRLMDGLQGRTARYRALALLLFPDGREMRGEGMVEGVVAESASGTKGFGYDPLFVPDGEVRTMAELSDAEKNAISHRARALQALVEALG